MEIRYAGHETDGGLLTVQEYEKFAKMEGTSVASPLYEALKKY